LNQCCIVSNVLENTDFSHRTGGLICEWSVKAVQTSYTCNKMHCLKVTGPHLQKVSETD